MFSLNLFFDKEKEKEKQIRPFYLRKALINLLSEEIDKLRANSFSEFVDKYNVIKNPYSLADKKLSSDDVKGIVEELMQKSPQLTLNILRKLAHAIHKPQVSQQTRSEGRRKRLNIPFGCRFTCRSWLSS